MTPPIEKKGKKMDGHFFEAKWLKLFKNIREGESYDLTLISHGKVEWETGYDNELFEETIKSYKHFLFINLWIVRLTFIWIKKV